MGHFGCLPHYIGLCYMQKFIYFLHSIFICFYEVLKFLISPSRCSLLLLVLVCSVVPMFRVIVKQMGPETALCDTTT